MPTGSTSSAQNIRMSTCKVTFDGNDLGLTIGGVDVKVASTTHETKVDQFGDTVANEFIMGRTITVTVPLAETTLQNLVAIMPGATLVTDATDPTKLRVDVTSGVGQSLLAIAKEMILHPIDKADTDVSEDLNIPLCATAGAIDFAYMYNKERVFNCTFKGYPDRANGGLLFSYGDLTATA